MSTTLRTAKLIDLCTSSISYDNQVKSGCEAFDPQMYEIIDDTGQVIMIPNIMGLTDSTLVDILAWQFHVDFYDPTDPLEFRKQLVQLSITWHMTKGTVQLVEDVLNMFFPKGAATVQEWYQYMEPLPPNYPIDDADVLNRVFGVSDVNPSTDKFLFSGHGLVNGDQVRFKAGVVRVAGGDLPTPIVEGFYYYVAGALTNSFQISPSPGGSIVNLLDSGSGSNNECWKRGLGSWHDRYRFRVLIDDSVIPPEQEQRAVTLIERYKPVSRWLEGFVRATVSECDIGWIGAMLRFIYRESEAPDYEFGDTPVIPETLTAVTSSGITMDGSCYIFGLCNPTSNALKMVDLGINGAWAFVDSWEPDPPLVGRIWEYQSAASIQINVYPHNTSGDACGGTPTSTNTDKARMVIGNINGTWYVQVWNNYASPSTYPLELFFGSAASLGSPIANQLTSYAPCTTHVRSDVFTTEYWGGPNTWVVGGQGGTVNITL